MSLTTPEEFARLIDDMAARAAKYDGGSVMNTYNVAALIETRDKQVRHDEWARMTEADFIAYGVERGWLSEETIPAFHGFGFTEPAVRRHVTAGEELPPDPPPTPEQIEVLRRRLRELREP